MVAGTNLLQAIIAAGAQLVSKCGGEAKCSACHVGVGSKSRLACQATLLGAENVSVELLGALSG